ncbi:MAG: helix-turn-helix domain-containing protein [Aeromicrobium sp.]
MALSSVDTNKWKALLEQGWERVRPPEPPNHGHRQCQKRLTEADIARMAARYAEGGTVYRLAKEFGVARTTVANRLKKAGVSMRGQSPAAEQVDEMVRLYESGQSLHAVGQELGFDPKTIHTRLLKRGVAMRDSHGRVRSS